MSQIPGSIVNGLAVGAPEFWPGGVNPFTVTADAGAFPIGAGVNPTALQSLYSQLGINNAAGLAPRLSSLPFGAGAGVETSALPFVGGAGGGVSGAAGAASGGGRLASLLGRVPTSLPSGTPLIEGGLRSFAGRAAPPLILSQLATAGVNAALPSTGGAGDARQILGDAATGAGIGATVGLLGGPFAPLTSGTGALIGGIAGGAYGAIDSFFGDDGGDSSSDYRKTLVTAAAQLGLDPAQYSAAWDLLTKSGADPKQLSVQLSNQLLQDASLQKQQQQAIAQAAQQRQMDQKFALAIQAQAAEFFAPYTNNIITAGATQAQLLSDLASQLPPAYAGVMKNQAQQALSQAQRLAGAYAAQTALIPGQFMAQAELKRQAELQKYQYQQQVIQSQQGGGGGGTGYDQLVQQLAGQTQQPVTTG